jgi:hypothetical protein
MATTNLQIGCMMDSHENKKEQLKERIETNIIAAIDSVLSSYGGSFKQLIYSRLRERFQIQQCEIPQKIDEFTAVLEEILGTAAALIEVRIMKVLHEVVPEFVHFPTCEDLVFADYVRQLRNSF